MAPAAALLAAALSALLRAAGQQLAPPRTSQPQAPQSPAPPLRCSADAEAARARDAAVLRWHGALQVRGVPCGA